jgi:hypothetical protein
MKTEGKILIGIKHSSLISPLKTLCTLKYGIKTSSNTTILYYPQQVGETNYPISKLRDGVDHKEILPIAYKGKSAGTLTYHLLLEYHFNSLLNKCNNSHSNFIKHHSCQGMRHSNTLLNNTLLSNMLSLPSTNNPNPNMASQSNMANSLNRNTTQ